MTSLNLRFDFGCFLITWYNLNAHNAKTVKGEKLNVLTGILYLAPAKLSGYEVCPKRTEGCTAACLYTAGMGGFSNVQKARIAKTKGENDESLDLYSKVIEQNPFCIDAFKERGALKLAVGDKDGAEEDMRQVLELNPNVQNDVNGEFTADGTENIQQKVEKAYRSLDPYGIGEIGL